MLGSVLCAASWPEGEFIGKLCAARGCPGRAGRESQRGDFVVLLCLFCIASPGVALRQPTNGVSKGSHPTKIPLWVLMGSQELVPGDGPKS